MSKSLDGWRTCRSPRRVVFWAVLAGTACAPWWPVAGQTGVLGPGRVEADRAEPDLKRGVGGVEPADGGVWASWLGATAPRIAKAVAPPRDPLRGAPPPNDLCANATAVGEGTFPFDTTNAGTDGPPSCGLIGSDVWYQYTPSASGNAIISTCGLTGLDTVLAVYDACGGAELVCLDDSCGLQTRVTVPVVAGSSVVIRLGGFAEQQGSGEFVIGLDMGPEPCPLDSPQEVPAPEGEPCGADLNGGCNMSGVTPISLFETVAGTAWADGNVRDTDWYEFVVPGACEVAWSAVGHFPMRLFILDGACPSNILATAASIKPCERACVRAFLPAAGTYRLFAAPDTFSGYPCGGSAGNDYFATLTARECTVCPIGAHEEAEVCGDDTNGGCNDPAFAVESIDIGESVCGTAWADGNVRDTDWYEFTLTGACLMSVCGRAEFALRLFVLDAACPPAVLATGVSDGPCREVCVYASLTPGTYRIFAGTDVFSGAPCGTTNAYALRVCCPAFDCQWDDEAAIFGCDGGVALPPDLDPAGQIVEEDVDMVVGLVEDLYPQFDTSLDLWYENFPCDPSIGVEVPPEAINPDFEGEIEEEGYGQHTAQEVTEAMAVWEDQLALLAAEEAPPFFPPLMAATGPGDYTQPSPPHCTQPGCEYVFGGRDIVFVHGLKLDHIRDRLLDDPGASTNWQIPTMFPGSMDNPEFYTVNGVDGYFKSIAKCTWEAHIEKFLRSEGYKNRYLIVAYPCTERAEIGAQAVLTQIGDAMRSGVGVVDLSGRGDTSKFGTPSFVVVSHSTGGLVTDIAMTAAALHSDLNAAFIPEHCKAHVAMGSVFSGSSFATAALVILGDVTTNPVLLSLACEFGLPILANATETFPCSPPAFPYPRCPDLFGVAVQSILLDLSPPVAQLRWGDYVRNTPTRTLTVVGAHPTKYGVLKHLFHLGFDDGVTTINSQVANPNLRTFWPSGFVPSGLFKVYDLCLRRLADNGPFIGSPKRANRYFVDQVVDPRFNATIQALTLPYCAAGATPYVSPWGMVEPVHNDLRGTPFDSLARSPNHFSYLQCASDHFSGYNGAFGGFHPLGPFYQDTLRDIFLERNWEETRVLTDPGVYAPYDMPFTQALAIDGQSLLTEACVPKVQESVCGRTIRFRIRIPFIGVVFDRTWWLWKRTHHRLEGWREKMVCEYMYESVLCERANDCPEAVFCKGQFTDGFEGYPLGPICPNGGWEGWRNQGDTCFPVTRERANCGVQSLKLLAGTDGIGQGNDTLHRLHQFPGGGRWTFRVNTFVPHGATGSAHVILMSAYDDSSYPDSFGTLIQFNASNGLVSDDFTGSVAQIVYGQWRELRAEIDLDNDRVDYFYGGVLFGPNKSWTHGSGRAQIDAVDFYGGLPGSGTSGMFVDGVSVTGHCDCNNNGVQDFLDIQGGTSQDANNNGIPDECEEDDCLVDWDGNGVINSNDFFGFLTDYFEGDADFNFDGLVNSNDFFGFLIDYFNPPVGCL